MPRPSIVPLQEIIDAGLALQVAGKAVTASSLRRKINKGDQNSLKKRWDAYLAAQTTSVVTPLPDIPQEMDREPTAAVAEVRQPIPSVAPDLCVQDVNAEDHQVIETAQSTSDLHELTEHELSEALQSTAALEATLEQTRAELKATREERDQARENVQPLTDDVDRRDDKIRMLEAQLSKVKAELETLHQADETKPQPAEAMSVEDNTNAYSRKAYDARYLLAEQGDSYALCNLDKEYREINVIVQDKKQAAMWLRTAAAEGDPGAQYNLGTLYLKGDGVVQDKHKAAMLFGQAADKSHVNAQYNLGLMCFTGDGVAQDKNQAAMWFRAAAMLGDSNAQYNLGLMFFTGDGVALDKDKAIMLFRQAAEKGHFKASCEVQKNYYYRR